MADPTLWKKVLSELELEVSPAVFNTMFRQTKLVNLSGSVATVGCLSAVAAKLIETRYYALLKRIIDQHVDENTSVVFTVDATLKKTDGQRGLSALGPLFQQESNFAMTLKRHGVVPEYTFENFAVSTSNQLAFAAASHVAKNPGNSYNPLFLYGGVGVGKTHLMHAIVHSVLYRDPATRLVLCAGEEFTNEIIEAIRTKTTSSFRNKFRSSSLLCVDDVQFIAGKVAVQEEFFHTFNTILKNGGQIVLTSDKPPVEILKLDARLKSRLEGGLLVDIEPPDFELRVAILLIKARTHGIDLPMPLAKLIAASITDTRALEGMLTRIVSEMHIKNTSLSEEFVLRLLGKKQGGLNQVAAQKTTSPTKDIFMERVCEYFSIKPTLLRGKRRDKNIVFPRQILMYLLRTELTAPLTEIGSFVGGRDHTTVLHGVGKVTTLLGINDRVRGDILGIKRLVYG